MRIVTVFHVRQIDRHNAVQQPQGIRLFVPACVPDDRQTKALRDGQLERRHNLRQKVGRGDKIDVVYPLPLQLQHPCSQFPGGDLFAVAELTDGEVLAEYAFQGTARQKNGAGALAAGYGRFFAAMYVGRGDLGLESRSADAPLTLDAIDTAVMGTEIAGGKPPV